MPSRAGESFIPREGDALVVVDVQNCFLPGGSLGVSGGDRIIPALNRALSIFRKNNLPVFFSRDWHPVNHMSFSQQGGPWPPHCVQDTAGAEFSSELALPPEPVILSKGTDPEREEYSAWLARGDGGKTLFDHLRAGGIRRLFIGGLTTEYCILSTVRDARREGYEIAVLTDAIQSVEAHPGDGEKALSEMAATGAKLISEKDLYS